MCVADSSFDKHAGQVEDRGLEAAFDEQQHKWE